MWTEEYWDIQRRAFWGVRRYFARRKTPLCSDCEEAKPDSSKHSFKAFDARLRKEEVFLNDILNLLMQLAPQSLYCHIIQEQFDEPVKKGSFESLGGSFLEYFGVGGRNTQPDFFAVGENHTFAIELKLGSKSDLRQVLLYAALAALEEQISGKKKDHFLLLLTPPRTFTRVWKEGFKTVGELADSLLKASQEPVKSAPKQAALFQRIDPQVVLPRFNIAHATFPEFADTLESLRPSTVNSDADEVLEKLLSGAAAEFRSYSNEPAGS